MFGGKCSLCTEKENRIADLQHQIEFMKTLLFPPKPTQDVSKSDLELDALLSGVDQAIPVDESSREADLLLTGEYSSEQEGYL